MKTAISSQQPREDIIQNQAFKRLGIFVLILIGLKFFLGWNVSIVGSVVLTIVLSIVISVANKR